MKTSFVSYSRVLFATIIGAGCLASASAAEPPYYGADASLSAPIPNSTAAEQRFLAALSSYGTDNLDSSLAFLPNPGLTFGASGITATTTFQYIATYPPLAVSDNNAAVDAGPPQPGGADVPDVITFSKPITAFGAYFANAGDFADDPLTPAVETDTLKFLVRDAATQLTKEVTIGTYGPNLIGDNVFYFGYVDAAPFDQISLLSSFDYDGVLLDNLTAGFAKVPEPSTLVLLGTASIGLMAAARRKRARALRG